MALSNWISNTKRVQARDKNTGTLYEFESVFPDGAPDGTPFSAEEMNKIVDAINSAEIVSGGDGNSNWVKLPDGTMIISIRSTAQVSETGGFVCTFPQPFSNAQYAIFANALIPYDYVAVAEGNDPGTSNIWIYDLTGGSAVGEWVNYTVMAIGRWK